jgi:hypothetical protein
MGDPSDSKTSLVSAWIAIAGTTAGLYAVGKWMTAFVPTPWGVGQLLIGIFLPAFMAVVADTVPVAIGAGIGTFVGDIFVRTNPSLSLVAGVPANFFAFLLFGYFVKKYPTWPAFVASTVAFVTLGNLIAATSVYLFAGQLLGVTLPSSAILGLTVFWNTTTIPAILIAVPILVRSVKPLVGRFMILQHYPSWSASVGSRQTLYALAYGLAFVAFGGAIFLLSPNSVSATPGLGYFAVAAVIVVLVGPLAGLLAGSKNEPRAVPS